MYENATTSAEFDPENKSPPAAIQPKGHEGEWRMTGCIVVHVAPGVREVAWYWQREIKEDDR